MKPLTIDELKALPVGEWVWIRVLDKEGFGINFPTQLYLQKADVIVGDHYFPFVMNEVDDGLDYRMYGTDWLAYKNKEFAESKGEWVELPCLRDKEPISLVTGKFVKRKELNYMTKDGTICSEIYWESDFEQAENRLREFQKECK